MFDDDLPRGDENLGEEYRFNHYYTLERHYMRTSDMIQSKFLKKEDFATPAVLTIKNCTLEKVGNRGDERWVLWFNERTKGLTLNVTKIKQIEAAYGQESDHWIGKKVRLSIDENVMFGTEKVGGIRLETPKSASAPPVNPPPPADPDFDDDIPF
jgi:hypothetical protein